MGIIFNKVFYQNAENISLEVKDNKITGVIGNSESYKEEIFDLISGRVFPKYGKIFGESYNISYVCQVIDDQFFYDKIGDQFFFTLKLKGVTNIFKRASDSLKIMGLTDDYLKRDINSLSFSEQRLVSFALALSINPKTLILYEPFLGLDKSDTDNIIKIIRMMKIRYSKTIIIFSKDTDMIHRICDEIILVNDGKILRIGDKYSIFSDEKLMRECHLEVPKVMCFSNVVMKKKNIDIGYRNDVDDLIKDIYRFVR